MTVHFFLVACKKEGTVHVLSLAAQHGNEHCRGTFLAHDWGPFVTGKAVTHNLFHRLQAISVLLKNVLGGTQINRGKVRDLSTNSFAARCLYSLQVSEQRSAAYRLALPVLL